MFSTPSSVPGAAVRASRPWSIAGRLTLHYAGATIAILILGGGFLYWGLARELERQKQAFVTSKLRVLQHLTATYPSGAEALASEIQHEAGEESALRYLLRVRDARGVTLLETSDMQRLAPAEAFPPPAADSVSTDECASCAASSDGRYLLAAAASTARGAGGVPLELQVALEVSAASHVLADYRSKLVAVLLVGLLVATGVGVVIAHGALRPVHDLSQRIQTISASQLDSRLVDARSWPSELRGVAGEFDAMLDRLQDSFARLTQFSGDLAHALRNPINNLRGEAEVALARARTADEYQQVLGSGLEELARLSRLIDGLLFIARAEDPHQALSHTRFSARRELDAVSDFYEALAAERQMRVECEGEAWLDGDPVLFRRAVSNLLANALNYTPNGGLVRMTVTEQAEFVEVRVTDTGPGIAASHLPHVFERFYRVEVGQARVTSGAGLGLAIVQSIMRLHGGTVRIESAVGHGTTVVLTFAAVKPTAGAG